jgi:hypothetical protein
LFHSFVMAFPRNRLTRFFSNSKCLQEHHNNVSYGMSGPTLLVMCTITSIPCPYQNKSMIKLNWMEHWYLQQRWYFACWHFSFCKCLTHQHTPFFLSILFMIIFLHFMHFCFQKPSSVAHCALLLILWQHCKISVNFVAVHAVSLWSLNYTTQ